MYRVHLTEDVTDNFTIIMHNGMLQLKFKSYSQLQWNIRLCMSLFYHGSFLPGLPVVDNVEKKKVKIYSLWLE
jgi:hypothetical protein